ncbi:MAG: RAD52 family DNA repair protein [Cellulomonas sp.]|nr:Rad52/Rad22 family DNA repair protein [Cellulomonas sp.]MCR6649766.1 RAD52 family DNA repair protein [Cellulomonas sp.]
MTYLAGEQIAQLLRPINPSRVMQRDGMSHVEAYDIRAHLNRIFGFGRWSADVLDADMLFETVGPKSERDTKVVVSVGYRARLRLAVHAPDGTVLATYTEVATGDAVNFPVNKRADAHDFAVKTAESQALKRAAVNLGDQFGLSLYRKGSTDAVVMRTLVAPEAGAAETEVEHGTPDVVPEVPEVDGAGSDEQPQESPPAPERPQRQSRQTRPDELNAVKARIAALLTGRSRSQIAAYVAEQTGKPDTEWTVDDLTSVLAGLEQKAVA